MSLVQLWFFIIVVAWLAFFILEGFDLGVGILHRIVSRNETERQQTLGTIAPFWDANEVWLIVAVAAMFAAFPAWYATMFSAFYLLMVIVLVGLIARGVAFEFRDKSDKIGWRRTWDACLSLGSFVVVAGLGIALANLLHGVPIDKNQEFTGSFGDLFNPFTLLAGLTLVLLCIVHGATFLALQTDGRLNFRCRRWAAGSAPVAALIVIAFVFWAHATQNKGFFPHPLEVVAAIAVLATAWLVSDEREGWAFVSTTIAMVATVGSFFVELYPRVMVSSTNSSYDLTIHNTASPPYTLKVLTVIAVVLLPVVIAYQAWSYRVFHRRISVAPSGPVGPTPNGSSEPDGHEPTSGGPAAARLRT
jgi:cytochrome bd ubiquinol oxidase subunit II